MDFGQLISKSFQITLKHRVLWIFGVVLAIVGGFPNAFNFSFNFPSDFNSFESEPPKIFSSLESIKYIDSSSIIMLIIVALLVLVGITFLTIYLQFWSQAALLSQTLSAIHARAATFKEGKEMGEKFFWRFFGFRILLGLIVIPIVLLFVLFPLVLFLVGLTPFAIFFGVIEIIIFIIGIIVYIIIASIVSELGLREMVERDLGVVDSIRFGWELFKNNLGDSLLVWLVSIAAGFIISFPILISAAILAPLGIGLFFINPWLIAIPIALFIVAFLIIGGVWNVFLAAYWGLAYNVLVNKGGVNTD